MPKFAAFAHPQSWSLSASALQLECLTAGFPEKRCHLSYHHPHTKHPQDRVDVWDAVRALQSGRKCQPGWQCRHSMSRLLGPWRLWVQLHSKDKMCQRPHRVERSSAFLGLSISSPNLKSVFQCSFSLYVFSFVKSYLGEAIIYWKRYQTPQFSYQRPFFLPLRINSEGSCH